MDSKDMSKREAVVTVPVMTSVSRYRNTYYDRVKIESIVWDLTKLCFFGLI